MFALDLFAGLGGATQAMTARGWDVVTVDVNPDFAPTVVADLAAWSWRGRRPDLVWASPPCNEFSREAMPWCRTGKAPDLSLLRAAVRIIREAEPRFWVVENVRGAVKWFRPVLGPHRRSYGPFYLWGDFPDFACTVRPFKERLSSSRRAERAMVPECLSRALAMACESTLF